MNRTGTWLVLWMMPGLLFWSCNGQNGRERPPGTSGDFSSGVSEGQPVAVFPEKEHDFGTVIEGEMVLYSFVYRNEGTGSLMIRNVSSSCGCTTPDWSEAPLEPGEEAILKVVFDSSGRKGAQHKEITVYSNADPVGTTLHIRAQVIER